MELAKHIIYRKDAEGNTFTTAEVVFENRIIQHPALFPKVDFVLENIHKFPTREDDIWLIDYSKSGSTWLFEVVNWLVHREPSGMMVDKLARMVEVSAEFEHFEKMKSPRIVNTHLKLQFMPKEILNKGKIIFIIRNPKSTAVSLYHHQRFFKFMEYEGTFAGFLPVFIKGVDDLYGNWFDHTTEYWEALKNKKNVLFIFYEDMKKNPLQTFRTMSEFLGVPSDENHLQKVVQETSFDKMKSNQKPTMDRLQLGKPERSFFRKGSTSDWRSHFTVAQNEMFDAIYEEKMKPFPELRNKIQFS